jgi:hypothetical protein
MQPSNQMLAELRTLAAVRTGRPVKDIVEDGTLTPLAEAAYAIGKIDGRCELARVLLEDLRRGE